jgi:hypothetical protein
MKDATGECNNERRKDATIKSNHDIMKGEHVRTITREEIV